jgi:hypothetical protein
MDFKKTKNYFSELIIINLFVFFLVGCSEKEKSNTENTFYIELINFTKDSLKQKVSESIFGKVAYYNKDKLVILSLNYVTEDFPNMHYFKNAEELISDIKPGTKKIKIEFGGEYTVDSISYSLQKFIYKNNLWLKTSDMGFIKGTTTYKKAKQFSINEFAKQIVNNTVIYTYN